MSEQARQNVWGVFVVVLVVIFMIGVMTLSFPHQVAHNNKLREAHEAEVRPLVEQGSMYLLVRGYRIGAMHDRKATIVLLSAPPEEKDAKVLFERPISWEPGLKRHHDPWVTAVIAVQTKGMLADLPRSLPANEASAPLTPPLSPARVKYMACTILPREKESPPSSVPWIPDTTSESTCDALEHMEPKLFESP